MTKELIILELLLLLTIMKKIIFALLILAIFLLSACISPTYCGDGICQVNEDSQNCPEDCGIVDSNSIVVKVFNEGLERTIIKQAFVEALCFEGEEALSLSVPNPPQGENGYRIQIPDFCEKIVLTAKAIGYRKEVKEIFLPFLDQEFELIEGNAESPLPFADANDLEFFEVRVQVLDMHNNPVENAKVRLVNQDNEIYFPIQKEFDFEKSCDRAFNNGSFFAVTDTNGFVSIEINRGNYVVLVTKEPSRENQNGMEKVLFLQEKMFLSSPQQITIKSTREIETSFEIFSSVSTSRVESYDLRITLTEQKPGFSFFDFGKVDKNVIIATNNMTDFSLMLSNPLNYSKEGMIVFEDISPKLIKSNSYVVRRNKNDMAYLIFNVFDGTNSFNKNMLGGIKITFPEFAVQRAVINFDVYPSARVYVDPTNIQLLYSIEDKNFKFSLKKGGEGIIRLNKKEKRIFNFGGPFNGDMKVATHNFERSASKNYFWFVIKDAYGNLVDGYSTNDPIMPRVIVRQGSEIVYDQNLIGEPESIHIDSRATDYYFEDMNEYIISFSESFGDFGEVNIVEEALADHRMELTYFESENIEFIMPKEINFLENNWKNNFELFYGEMYKLIGVKTSEKIPFRTAVDGADRAWAPIMWPLVATDCEVENYECWFLITHELGHPFTLNEPLSWPAYNEESKASYLAISSSKAVKEEVGNYMQANYPMSFARMKDEQVCFDEIEAVQTLMLYMDEKYPGIKPSAEMIRNWDSNYSQLFNEGMYYSDNKDAVYGAIYSIIVRENVGNVFEKFGLSTEEEVTDVLSLFYDE